MKNLFSILFLFSLFFSDAQTGVIDNNKVPMTRNITINGIAYNLTADRSYTTNFSPTNLKTVSYTLTPFEFVPVDLSVGSLTVTLPANPTNRTYACIKIITAASPNVLTIKTGTSTNTINRAGGVTSFTLAAQNQGYQFLYSSLTSVWYITSDDLPSTYLDTKYWGFSGNAVASNTVALGTTDARSLRVITNNIERLVIDSSANANAKLKANFLIDQSAGVNTLNPKKVSFAPWTSDNSYLALTLFQNTPDGMNYSFVGDTATFLIMNHKKSLLFNTGHRRFMSAQSTFTASGSVVVFDAITNTLSTTGANLRHINIGGNTNFYANGGTTALHQSVLISAETHSTLAGETATITNDVGVEINAPIAAGGLTQTTVWALSCKGNENILNRLSIGSSLLSPLGLLHLSAPPSGTCAIKFTSHTIPTLNTGEMDFNTTSGWNWKGNLLQDGTMNVTGNATVTGTAKFSDNISIATAGKGLVVASGSNAKIGNSTLSGGTIVVANTSITANSKVFTSARGVTAAGSLGVTYNAGTGFTISSSSPTDARVVDWFIIESQ